MDRFAPLRARHVRYRHVAMRWVRELPNVIFLHFNELKRDISCQMRRMTQFLDIPVDETQWKNIFEYCSLDWIKRNVTKSVPLGGAFWDGGAETFINKGINGRWKDLPRLEESAKYEASAVQELGPECVT